MNEFEFLKKLKQHFNFQLTGDDCAVLQLGGDRDLLVTADLLIEDVDFRLSWEDPCSLGHKALAVSLSDIAAMGGEAAWAVISLGIPDRWWKEEVLLEFYTGISSLADKFGVRIAGGDISRSPDRFVIDSMVIGFCPQGRAVMRSGASPGDLICVTGALGGAAGGLALLESGNADTSEAGAERAELVEKQLKPVPQLEKANLLQTHHLAKAMIDLSDGLSSDLRHICEASSVGAVVYSEKVPVHPFLAELEPRELLPFESPMEAALNGGEDFELLFTTDPANRAQVEEIGCTVVGETVGESETFEIEVDGKREKLRTAGYIHFGGRDS